jgi:hypothetical protein
VRKERLRRTALQLGWLRNNQTVLIRHNDSIEKEIHELVKGLGGQIKVFQLVIQEPAPDTATKNN